ncbi:hypothetical protein MNBD_GAMMA22-945 [hydrothermal vent metagenome]|uniref:TauD/TfdA-like domain-containing protein n=1 Tax=hydrothermal vent metagenome TaxID=652676 RepID=A0A3B1A571_9ZZZZ
MENKNSIADFEHKNSSPFNLVETHVYQKWRDAKLKDYPKNIADLIVEINDPRILTKHEHQKLIDICRKTNMVLYSSKLENDPNPEIPLSLGRRFVGSKLDNNWLADGTGLTSLTVAQEGVRQHYIPYTNRAIQWHTDGYYNPQHQQIYSLLLHAVQRAASGGENALLDHEIAYILLREKNPDYVAALMKDNVLTIPARIESGKIVRAEQSGSIFSVSRKGQLHMRYTIRDNNVMWSEDELTQQALEYLKLILSSDSPYIFKGLLQPGMGLLSNNVLHNRTAFTDDASHKRFIYRARYFNRLLDC